MSFHPELWIPEPRTDLTRAQAFSRAFVRLAAETRLRHVKQDFSTRAGERSMVWGRFSDGKLEAEIITRGGVMAGTSYEQVDLIVERGEWGEVADVSATRMVGEEDREPELYENFGLYDPASTLSCLRVMRAIGLVSKVAKS